jgi:hypothetical protein
MPKEEKKAEKKAELQDNPLEYTTCQNCGTRRKLPEPCKCPPVSTWK